MAATTAHVVPAESSKTEVMNSMNTMMKAIALAATSTLLVACAEDEETGTGTLSVSLTDAPIDEAYQVMVEIPGLQLQNGDDGGWVDYDFEDTDGNPAPVSVDLLALQGGASLPLLDGIVVDAGEYHIRLKVNQDEIGDSYLVLEEGGAEHELTIPSGGQTGLKLTSTIVVPVNGVADYTIDFDVRQSVVRRGNGNNPDVEYALAPVLRLIDNTVAGHIAGEITDTDLLTTDCSDGDPLTNNVIYVFEDFDVTPDDYDGNDAEAVTTAPVVFDDEEGTYTYRTAPLLAGNYTVSLTCNSDLEEMGENDELLFKATENVTIVADS